VDVFDAWYRMAALLLGIILVSLAFAPLKPAQVLLGFGLAQSIFVGTVLWPHAGELQQGPVKRAALFARSLTEPVFGYRIRMPSFSVYRQAVTTDTEHPRRARSSCRGLITSANCLRTARTTAGCSSWHRRHALTSSRDARAPMSSGGSI
jgi:hypothetical protein